MWLKKPAHYTCEYVDRKNKNAILRTCNFVLLVQNWAIFAVEMSSTVSTPHSQFQLNHARLFQLPKIGLVSLFFLFFFFFRQSVKVRNGLSDCLEIWYKKSWCKGASWYQVWLQYDKHSQQYLQLFTKSNTNMLSHPQGKPHMARS